LGKSSTHRCARTWHPCDLLVFVLCRHPEYDTLDRDSGIGHYFGVPYGVVGVIMASFLGWMLGKAMLETRGFFWAWLIHFVQDVLIFTFMAAGSITPGG